MLAAIQPTASKPVRLALNTIGSLAGIVLVSLILGGCTSIAPIIPDSYPVRLHQKGSQTGAPEVRISYLGLCLSAGGEQTCAAATSKYKIASQNIPAGTGPYYDLGKNLAMHVFWVVLEAIASGLFVFGALMTIWHMMRIEQAGRLAKTILMSFLVSSTTQLIAFIAFWWVGNTMKYSTDVGSTADIGSAMFYSHIALIFYPVVMMFIACSNMIAEARKKGKGGGGGGGGPMDFPDPGGDIDLPLSPV